MVTDLPLCGYFLSLHGQPGQGELQARGQYVKMYRGPLNGLLVMVRTDGLKAVQAGLAPAMMYQMVMNGLRLGSYAMLETAGFVQDSEGQLSLARCTLCSAASGLVGGVVGSPLFLVKTHLQTSSSATIAVGHQHRHRGAVAGLRDLYSAGGVTGLWQGVSASVPRISLGSAAQLVTYSHVNAALAANTRLAEGSWQVNLCGALLSGFVVAVVINPVDVVSTRLYNQPAQVRPMRGRQWIVLVAGEAVQELHRLCPQDRTDGGSRRILQRSAGSVSPYWSSQLPLSHILAPLQELARIVGEKIVLFIDCCT